MTLPINLVLVRHGDSEGNEAKRRSERGDHSAVEKLKDRHTRSYRLTEKGRRQANLAGSWLREEFPAGFDRYFTSEYARAMETAGLLKLSSAEWGRNFYLSERDWGNLDRYNEEERREKFGDELRMKDVEPFYWRPGSGETLAQLSLRLDRVLFTLHNECSDKNVILVCHGEVMWVYRVLLERMPQDTFKRLHLSKRPEDRIHNCEVIHYTRRDPETGRLAPFVNWMRRVRPTDSPIWTTGWEKIVRKRYSGEDLLRIVEDYPHALT